MKFPLLILPVTDEKGFDLDSFCRFHYVQVNLVEKRFSQESKSVSPHTAVLFNNIALEQNILYV